MGYKKGGWVRWGRERERKVATVVVYRPIRGGHEKPSFRLGGGGGRLQNAPSANAFL